jgi:hypothetical protein
LSLPLSFPLTLVRLRPGTPIRELAHDVYNDSGTDGQNKTRSLLAALKKKGLVTNVGSGKWEAVSKD